MIVYTTATGEPRHAWTDEERAAISTSIRERACDRKISYATEEDAQRGAARARRLYNDEQRPYRCQFCPAWHTSHLKV